jgi:hypothetical protein
VGADVETDEKVGAVFWHVSQLAVYIYLDTITYRC